MRDRVYGVLILVNLYRIKCGHTDINRDDGFRLVSQREWGFSRWNTLGGPVRPQHPWKFLHPHTFCFVESLTQAVKNSAVAYFSLAIALWIVRDRELVDDFILGAKVPHLPAREIGLVIGDDDMRKSELAYNILPEEHDYLLP